MKPTLKPGLTHRFTYTVPVAKTVPHLYAESPELAAMPEVFATGFMVGLMEWTCVQLLGASSRPWRRQPRRPYRRVAQGGNAGRLHHHRRCRMHRGEGAARKVQRESP